MAEIIPLGAISMTSDEALVVVTATRRHLHELLLLVLTAGEVILLLLQCVFARLLAIHLVALQVHVIIQMLLLRQLFSLILARHVRISIG